MKKYFKRHKMYDPINYNYYIMDNGAITVYISGHSNHYTVEGLDNSEAYPLIPISEEEFFLGIL